MTDSQLVAAAITVSAVLGGTLFNNIRIGDLNSNVAGKISNSKEVFRAQLQVLRGEMKLAEARTETRFDRIDHKLDEILRIVGEHETRLAKLEQH